jgi:hypothetical protein
MFSGAVRTSTVSSTAGSTDGCAVALPALCFAACFFAQAISLALTGRILPDLSLTYDPAAMSALFNCAATVDQL